MSPYALDGVRVYKVKDPKNMRTKRKTFKSKDEALSALHKRGKVDHKKKKAQAKKQRRNARGQWV